MKQVCLDTPVLGQSEEQGLVPGSSSDTAAPPPGGLGRHDLGDDVMEESIDDGEDAMDVEHVAHVVGQDFIGSIDHSKGGLGSLEPDVDDVVAQLLVTQMGSTSRSLRREHRSGMRRIVSEIYSPARVAQMTRDKKMRHVLPGFACDITMNDPEDGLSWDVSLKAKRDKARKQLREQKPYMLIGSPECAAFSVLQNLNTAESRDP